MESPAKRRKKNDSKASPLPNRGLDFFFGKQAANQKKPEVNGTAPTGDKDATIETSDAGEGLTDEELARKLQEEWAQQDGQEQASTVITVPEPSTQDSIDGNADGKKNVLGLQSTGSAEDTITLNIPFDQSPLTFDPSQYLPEMKKHWAADGGDASYALLTRCFVLVNSTQSRIKIVDTLVNCLRTLIQGNPASLLPAVWLATNSISPPYIDLELGLGGSAISKGLKKVCGLDGAGLKTLYDKHGDAGDVAFEAKKRQKLHPAQA